MIRNYLRVAFRNLIGRKRYSVLNIAGLSMGMACCLMILLYVSDEKSFDKWLPDNDRIYRMAIDIKAQNGDHLLFAPITGMASTTVSSYPQVEEVTRIMSPFTENTLVSNGIEKSFYETRFYWADPNVFEIFKYKFLSGNPSSALSIPNTIVINRDIAEKYFTVHGDWPAAIGKTMRIGSKEYHVTAIMDKLPGNSIFQPELIASMKEFDGTDFVSNWHATMFYTFLKTKPGVEKAQFEKEISNLADKYVGDEIKKAGQAYRFFLQPVTSIHLHSDLRYELSKNNSASYVSIFLAAAIFILLIACANFINMATAVARQRAREVGVRKVIGAQRRQLVGQFLTESFLLCFSSLILAFMLLFLLLPLFNNIAFKELKLDSLFTPSFIGISVAVMSGVALLAGFYPALILSNFSPINALNSRYFGGNKTGRVLRSGLVTGQFVISIGMIIATIIVTRQVDFLKQQHLGFDKDQLLVIQAPGGKMLKSKYKVIREELLKIPAVRSVTVSGTVPGRFFGNNLIQVKGDHNRSTDMKLIAIDEKFLPTYNISLAAGRNISENIFDDTATTSDFSSVLINESAVKAMGWKKPDDAIGQVFDGGWGRVVGVVKDFHFTSLQTKVVPLELYFGPRQLEYVSLKVGTADIQNTIASLAKSWKTLAPTHPFEYFFLDDDFNKQYLFENRLEKLFGGFSFIAIFIACLGLFGLAAFTVVQRTKEIGIRKVLGASTRGIVSLLSMDFLKLIAIAAIIAFPVSWWAMNKWLQGFAYRIPITWWVFAFATSIVLLVALITISFQAIKAAIANPVKSLRTE